jgi:hypothetical protein
MSSFFQDADIAQIGYSAGSIMSHNDLYSNFLRTVPSDAYDAKIAADVIYNNFGWDRCVVFSATEDTDSADSYVEFFEEAAFLGIDIVASEFFPVDEFDYSTLIKDALTYDPRVIVLLMQPQNTASFMIQAYAQGLVKEGVTVIGTSLSAPSNLLSYFNTTLNSTSLMKDFLAHNVTSLMKGFLAISPQMNWTTTASGSAFLERFRQQPDTISYDTNGVPICNNGTDDDGHFFLYKQYINYDVNKPYRCAGIEFSKMDASNIYLTSAFAYDAVHAMARGLNKMVYTSPFPGFSGRILKKALIDNISFEGATGTIAFSAGRTSFNTYGIGDRLIGLRYQLLNFNDAAFAAGQVMLQHVGDIDVTSGLLTLCDAFTSTTGCVSLQYNSLDNSLPSDSPPDIANEIPEGLQLTLTIIAAVLMVLSAASIGFLLYQAWKAYQDALDHDVKSAWKKATKYLLVKCTLFGCILGCGRVLVSTYNVDSSVCVARVWFVHLTFLFMVGSIMARMERLNLIINTKGFQKVTIDELTAFYWFACAALVDIIYLAITTGVGNYQPAQIFTVSITGQKTYSASCSADVPAIEYVLLGFEFLALFLCLGLCAATANAPKAVNETSTNVRITIGVALFFVAYVIQVFDADINPVTMRAVVSCVFLVSVVITLLLTMIPKISNFSKERGRRGTASRMKSRDGGSYSSHMKPEEVLGGILSKYNSLERDNKIEMCAKHIEIWRNLLVDMEISEERDPKDAIIVHH